ncbi:ERO1-like protein beta [Rhopilema esculentum]|uniref:ERO1-like protein beta n=1 Tax=Rhopilema esculentum TaxID=499914 RepID=UPI0031D71840
MEKCWHSCTCERFTRATRPTKFTTSYRITKSQILRILVVMVMITNGVHGNDKCFCKLKGQLEDCCCSVETVDSLNNAMIFPRISSLLSSFSYFKYFKVNLKKGCPFWPDDSRCAIKDCAVDFCSEDEIPIGITKSRVQEKTIQSTGNKVEFLENDDNNGKCAVGDLENLGNINSAISDEQLGNFEQWNEHDDTEDKFCDIDDEQSPDMTYVDLTLNPERYTGYTGSSAKRIWDSIYKENCFQPQKQKLSYANPKKSSIESMCLERRIFYRVVSGMHASINIHLSYNFLLSGSMYGKKVWGPNVNEFRKRFDPDKTKGQGPVWLKNLYTTYLLVLRAVTKAKPYWEKETFYTGNAEEDKRLKDLVLDILKSAMTCPRTFDETLMFSGDPLKARNLKEEFRSHFYNITRIMDCVGCDKCRLWGKLQTQGLGTALKILFSSDNWETIPVIKGKKFKLTRAEIVSLFNALGRFSSSVHALSKFREMK